MVGWQLITLSLLTLSQVTCGQLPYGLSQLDAYTRIAQSQNIAGMGLLQEAVKAGKVRTLTFFLQIESLFMKNKFFV